MKRRKTIRAGRLVHDCVYTMCYPSDVPRVRREKQKCSSAARQRMNLKRAAQKLELSLAANFGPGDLVLSLDYRDDALPETREDAVKLVRKFLRQLRQHRKARGQELRYIYVTEGLHGDKRVHHHLVINGTGNDLETLRSLWPHGGADLCGVSLRDGYYALAEYLTKEPRNGDRKLNGSRCWTPSTNLRKPEVESSLIPDSLTLSVPPGAVVLDRDSTCNEYGEFVYLKYLLPASAELPVKQVKKTKKAKARKPGKNQRCKNRKGVLKS